MNRVRQNFAGFGQVVIARLFRSSTTSTERPATWNASATGSSCRTSTCRRNSYLLADLDRETFADRGGRRRLSMPVRQCGFRPHGDNLRLDHVTALVIDDNSAADVDGRNDSCDPRSTTRWIFDPLCRDLTHLAPSVTKWRPLIDELAYHAAHVIRTQVALRRVSTFEQAAEHWLAQLGRAAEQYASHCQPLTFTIPRYRPAISKARPFRATPLTTCLLNNVTYPLRTGKTMPVNTCRAPLTEICAKDSAKASSRYLISEEPQ